MRFHAQKILWAAIPAVVALVACETSVSQVDMGGGSSTTTLPSPGTDGGGTLTETSSTKKQCVATECPAPLATCDPSHLCGVDLSTDINNCGGCGLACANLPGGNYLYPDSYYNMVTGCLDGVCTAGCKAGFADCNGIIDDGCEVNLAINDANNCGGCGIVCAESACTEGRCMCPPDRPDYCDPMCVNKLTDTQNCGTCGKSCGLVPCPSNPETQHVSRACGQGECVISCGPKFLDCNDDLSKGCGVSDGCEVPMDSNNCGACGRVCLVGFTCVDVGSTLECHPDCGAGFLICPAVDFGEGQFACIDPQVDPLNCGGCGLTCDSDVCRRGVCAPPACAPDTADCDDQPGCEVNLLTDPLHCGSCDVSCDVALGQPCVRGQCLTKDCDDNSEVPR